MLRQAQVKAQSFVFSCVFALSAAAVGAATFIVARPAQARALDPIDDVERDTRLKDLVQVPWGGKATEVPDGSQGGCERSKLTLEIADPLTGLTKPQAVVIVRPQSERPVPVMILIPTIQGPGKIERTLQGEFCDMNVATILADVNDPNLPKQIPSWGLEDVNNRYAIVALRTIIDYATTSPFYDPKRVGLMGNSLGGITTSMMAGIESDRLSAIVIVVGGGNMPFILASSAQGEVADLRRQRMAFEKYQTVGEYEERLRLTMKYDSMYFANRAKRENIFMVMSSSDKAVPTVTQQDLFNAFHQPENTVFSVGHVQTIIGITYFYFNYVSNFVSKRFELTSGRDLNMRSLAIRDQHRAERRQDIPEAYRELTGGLGLPSEE